MNRLAEAPGSSSQAMIGFGSQPGRGPAFQSGALQGSHAKRAPNPSVEARPNGKPTRPPPGCAYHPSGGRAPCRRSRLTSNVRPSESVQRALARPIWNAEARLRLGPPKTEQSSERFTGTREAVNPLSCREAASARSGRVRCEQGAPGSGVKRCSGLRRQCSQLVLSTGHKATEPGRPKTSTWHTSHPFTWKKVPNGPVPGLASLRKKSATRKLGLGTLTTSPLWPNPSVEARPNGKAPARLQVVLIIRPAGLALPRRRPRLTSNVRPHETMPRRRSRSALTQSRMLTPPSACARFTELKAFQNQVLRPLEKRARLRTRPDLLLSWALLHGSERGLCRSTKQLHWAFRKRPTTARCLGRRHSVPARVSLRAKDALQCVWLQPPLAGSD